MLTTQRCISATYRTDITRIRSEGHGVAMSCMSPGARRNTAGHEWIEDLQEHGVRRREIRHERQGRDRGTLGRAPQGREGLRRHGPPRHGDRHRGLPLPLREHRRARSQPRLPDADDVRLLRRRQQGDRPLRRAEPRVDPALAGAAARAGRGDRRGGPHVLHQQGHRPEGHHPGRLLQRLRQLHPGRLDHHPAVREGALPQPGAHAHAQDQGGVRLPEDPAAAVQAQHPRGLPQHHLLRPRRVRHRGCGAGLLRQAREGPVRG